MSDHSHQSGDAASRAMMDNLYWWGIPSLFRAAIADNPADLDIALVGVPHSTGNGTTERDQHLGRKRGAACFCQYAAGPYAVWILPAGNRAYQ